MQTYIIDSIKDCEKDKLYFFLLALSNPQPVVIVKSPSKTADIKKFLGYEWSSSKGNEGIKYIGANVVDEENELERNKGISQIKTPLFDPSNLHNEEKINMLIRHNFLGEELCIAENYKEYVSVHDLVDLMDFSRTEFDKVIKTVIDKATSIQSKYNQTKLGDLVNIIRGVVYNKDEQTTERTNNVILTADNITLDCRLNISKEVFLYNSKFLEEEKKLKKDDCFMCFSSGSKTHVGKIAFISSNTNYYAGGFMGILRVKVDNLLPKYLYLILSSKSMQDILSEESKGTNIKNLTNTIALVNIPLPPVNIQKKIIDEFNKIDEEYESSKRKIDECKKEIDNIFVNIKKQNIQSEKLEKLYVLMQRGKSPQYGNSGVQIIKSGQARGYETFDFSTKYYASENFVWGERRLEKGDILINSTGVGTAGRVTMFNLDGDFCVDSHITIFRTNERVCPKYALYALADIGFKNIEKMANGASGQIELSLSAIKRIEIPLPSIEHQKEIISQIERYESEMTIAQQFIDSYNDKKNAVLDKYLK